MYPFYPQNTAGHSGVSLQRRTVMARDPVCNVEVDETSAWYSEHQGRKYYFNSPDCKADFDRNPQRFMKTSERVSGAARSKIRSMLSGGKDKTLEGAGGVSHALRNTAQHLREQNQQRVAQYVETAADKVERFSNYLQQKDSDQIVRDVEDFVRMRPGVVIGSAFVAGFLLARFLKSSGTAVST